MKSCESEMDAAIELCEDLMDGRELVKHNPEKAAALMEMAGLLEGEIKEALIDYMAKTDQFYLLFTAGPGGTNLQRCLVLYQGDKLEMAY